MTILDKINQAISQGKKVYFTTYLKCIVVDAKTVAKFKKIGKPALKMVGNSLYIASGSKYVCVDYCNITVS